MKRRQKLWISKDTDGTWNAWENNPQKYQDIETNDIWFRDFDAAVDLREIVKRKLNGLESELAELIVAGECQQINLSIEIKGKRSVILKKETKQSIRRLLKDENQRRFMQAYWFAEGKIKKVCESTGISFETFLEWRWTDRTFQRVWLTEKAKLEAFLMSSAVEKE